MVTFVPRGPDIPYEVLEALDEHRLVFFCGAGISKPSDLPDFKELTQYAFDRCGIVLESNKTKASEPWEVAFHQGKLDKAFQLLEDRTAPGVMRRKVMDRLTENVGPQGLLLHKSILTLAALPGGGHRLVTTNFDDRFERAGLEVADSHDAPRLAPPRTSHWRHATYLHGRIDRHRDPGGCHLVLTSGDFGRAYLRDGWAARFVVELFREFTVLFIGYSLDDPVMGYLMDAMAADSGAGGQFRKAFIFADHSTKPGDRERVEAKWGASRHVVPIFFPVGRGRDFRLLHETLKAWAEQRRKGLDGRIEAAFRIGRAPFLPETPNAKDQISHLVWALADETGAVAKAVADSDVSLHESWIKPLSDFKMPVPSCAGDYSPLGLPSPPPIDGRGENGQPRRTAHAGTLAGQPAGFDGWLPLHPATFHLGRWIARHHLDKPESVAWAIANGGRLHPTLIGFIEGTLDGRVDLPGPYSRFWEILAMAPVRLPEIDGFLAQTLVKNAAEDRRPALLGQWLGAAATPFLEVEAPWSFNREGAGTDRLNGLARFVVKVRGPDMLRECLNGNTAYPEGAVDLLTGRLLEALRIEALVDGYILLDPLSNDAGHRDGWELLAHSCLAAWRQIGNGKAETARRVIRNWIGLGNDQQSAVFWWLVLNAATGWAGAPCGEIAMGLVGNCGFGLWADQLRADLLRFLRERGGTLGKRVLRRILRCLDAGPPQDHPDWQWENPEERELYILKFRRMALGKLLTGGAALDEPWRTEAEAVLEEHRREGLTENAAEQRPKFVVRSVPPPTADGLLGLPSAEAAEAIMKEEDQWDAGSRIADLVKRNPAFGLKVLDEVAARGQRREGFWISALAPLPGELAGRDVCERVGMLFTCHPDVLPAAAPGIAGLLSNLAGKFPESEEPACFWDLWDKTWNETTSPESGIVDGEAVTRAINHPAGKLAEALLDRLWKRPAGSENGLPSDLRPRFDLLIREPSCGGRSARVILASRLYWLFARDPAWSSDNLLARMDWGHDGGEAAGLWQGYLWQPRLGPELVEPLKPLLMEACHHSGDLPQEYLENLFGLLGEVLVVWPDAYGRRERRRLFADIPPEGLAYIAERFRQRLEAAGDKAPLVWREAIGPRFDDWPGARDRYTPRVNESLTRMLLATRDAFPEALGVLTKMGLPGPVSRSGFVLRRVARPEPGEEGYDYVEHHPQALFEMIARIIPNDLGQWDFSRLRSTLDRLSASLPDLLGDERYDRLDRLLRSG